MSRYLVRRLIHALITLLLISLITFTIIHLAPGGPSILQDPEMSQEEAAILRRNMGLDQPLYVQYAKWLYNILRGDFGRSMLHGQPVLRIIGARLWATVILALAGIIITLAVGLPLGVLCALHRNSWLDRLMTLLTFGTISIPPFWLGIMLILIFAVRLRWLPSAGMQTVGAETVSLDLISHLVMPALVLASFTLAQVIRYTRSSLGDVLRENYILVARAKGLTEHTVLARHALKNALIPVVTIIGLMLPSLIGGAAITETVFAWPGIGRLAVDAAFKRDYPVIMGITILVSIAVIASNLLVDLIYPLFDPRIKMH
jgi:peptide/nickel transport system permease protein